MSYIEVNHLTKKIKNKTILNDITFSLEKGKIYSFVGHNGSGKTMLFRALAGLLKLEKEAVKIEGREVNFNVNHPVSLGIILENPEFIGNFTGLQNLNYLAEINQKIGTKEVLKCLEDVKLTYAKDKEVKEYSLGMKQRLAICQAFMEDQELLLLDEPTNGLDREAYELFKELCSRWIKENRTILIATHDKYLAKELSDHIFELSDGLLVESYCEV